MKRKRNRKKAPALKDPAPDEYGNTVWRGEEEDFQEWVPPLGQSGNGWTSLNSKFGY
eukprot:m.908947 g.908947  ORF g.908947 m.908947 type:complete len:57 (+) comp60108_c0_seq4:1857-2027(+)